jgi:hypothetical protein
MAVPLTSRRVQEPRQLRRAISGAIVIGRACRVQEPCEVRRAIGGFVIIDAEKAKADIADSAGIVLGDFLSHQTDARHEVVKVVVSVYLLPVVQFPDGLDVFLQTLIGRGKRKVGSGAEVTAERADTASRQAGAQRSQSAEQTTAQATAQAARKRAHPAAEQAQAEALVRQSRRCVRVADPDVAAKSIADQILLVGIHLIGLVLVARLDPPGRGVGRAEIRLQLRHVIVVARPGQVLIVIRERGRLIAGIERSAGRRRGVYGVVALPELELIARRGLQRRERGLRTGRSVEAERVAERADALLSGGEVLLLRGDRLCGGGVDPLVGGGG